MIWISFCSSCTFLSPWMQMRKLPESISSLSHSDVVLIFIYRFGGFTNFAKLHFCHVEMHFRHGVWSILAILDFYLAALSEVLHFFSSLCSVLPYCILPCLFISAILHFSLCCISAGRNAAYITLCSFAILHFCQAILFGVPYCISTLLLLKTFIWSKVHRRFTIFFYGLKLHKRENFWGFDFEICTFS